MQQLVQRFHGHYTFYYGRPREYFHPVVSFYLLSFFLSSPNLSGHTLDVYHTSTHVALVRI